MSDEMSGVPTLYLLPCSLYCPCPIGWLALFSSIYHTLHNSFGFHNLLTLAFNPMYMKRYKTLVKNPSVSLLDEHNLHGLGVVSKPIL